MAEEELTEKISGTLRRGSTRVGVLDGAHAEVGRKMGLPLEERLAYLALRAGYSPGDHIDYEVTVVRKKS
jgi:hypothetical protein